MSLALSVLDDLLLQGKESRLGQKEMALLVEKALLEKSHAFIEAGTGTGKALYVKTPILTPHGFKAIRDLKPGDKVFDEKGQRVRVRSVFATQFLRPCFKVSFSDNSFLIADEEHEWFTFKKCTTKEIRATLIKDGSFLHSVPFVELKDPLDVKIEDPFVSLLIKGERVVLEKTSFSLQDASLMKSSFENSSFITTYEEFLKKASFGVKDSSLRYVTSVEPVPSVPVCCIEVESENHLYLAGSSLIPTHNSMAYLIPSILSVAAPTALDVPLDQAASLEAPARIVIATATKGLQEQLCQKDLPALKEVFYKRNISFSFELLKGRSNYLCLSRLEEQKKRPTFFDPLEEAVSWSEETLVGDKAEKDFTPSFWSKLSVSASECPSATHCNFGAVCFTELARARAKSVDILVVNHALYANHLVSGKLLPLHQALVIDEAHLFEEAVTDAFGVRISPLSLLRLVGHLKNLSISTVFLEEECQYFEKALSEVHALDELSVDIEKNPLKAAIFKLKEALLGALTSLVVLEETTHVKMVLKSIENLLESLESFVKNPNMLFWVEKDSKPGAKPILRSAPVDVGDILQENLFSLIPTIATSATLTFNNSFNHLLRRWGFLKNAASFSLSPVSNPSAGSAPVSTSSAMLIAADPAVKDLATRVPVSKSAASMSAASVSGASMSAASMSAVNFDPPVKDVFSKVVPEEKTSFAHVTKIVPSPFDYQKNAYLYIPDLPFYKSSLFMEEAFLELFSLLKSSNGRALVLFTSFQDLQNMASLLRENTSFHVLVQEEKSREKLIFEFKATPQSVLLANQSFWTGIDLPGHACNLVVIWRLPFPRPNDPLINAKRELAIKNRTNSFLEVDLPYCSQLLSQGVGRLIRTSLDKGVVAVFDKRLKESSYASSLLRTLPPLRMVTDVSQVKGALEFLDKKASESKA